MHAKVIILFVKNEKMRQYFHLQVENVSHSVFFRL